MYHSKYPNDDVALFEFFLNYTKLVKLPTKAKAVFTLSVNIAAGGNSSPRLK